MTKTRTELAEAIAERNEAAKAEEAAAVAFINYAGAVHIAMGRRLGEKCNDLRSKRWRCSERLEGFEARQRELVAQGADMVAVHRHFMRDYDKTADEAIAEARSDLQKAEKELAVLEHEMGKLDILWENAEANLDRCKRNVATLINSIFEGEASRVALELQQTVDTAMVQLGALLKVTERVNFMHRDVLQVGHPLYQAGRLIRQFEAFARATSSPTEMQALNREGAAPWIAAANRLAVDANSPLPTDPKPSPRRVAA